MTVRYTCNNFLQILEKCEEIQWHYIGAMQKGKARQLVFGKFHFIWISGFTEAQPFENLCTLKVNASAL